MFCKRHLRTKLGLLPHSNGDLLKQWRVIVPATRDVQSFTPDLTYPRYLHCLYPTEPMAHRHPRLEWNGTMFMWMSRKETAIKMVLKHSWQTKLFSIKSTDRVQYEVKSNLGEILEHSSIFPFPPQSKVKEGAKELHLLDSLLWPRCQCLICLEKHGKYLDRKVVDVERLQYQNVRCLHYMWRLHSLGMPYLDNLWYIRSSKSR